MSTLIIPEWDSRGVLPPIYPGESDTSPFRSPFTVSLLDLVLRFSTTEERCKILDGFLKYRKELHSVGLDTGFQWINGSFVEDVETLRERPPHDIDVVTFYEIPTGETQASIFAKCPDLFVHSKVKQKFSTDSYNISLTARGAEKWLIERSTYWYSMWAHQRSTFLWKGFLQIDLASTHDEEARQNLIIAMDGGCRP